MKNIKNNIAVSKVKIVINGINVYYFITRIKKNNINIFDINIISNKKAYLIILDSDYDKVIKFKSSYEIKKVEDYGIKKIKKDIFKLKFIIISIIISSILIFILSNMIFSIEIIHTNSILKESLEKQLEQFGISKFSFIKNYDELSIIKEEILNSNKETIEWLEIIQIGNSYTIKFEERIIPNTDNSNHYQNIVASKSGVIKNMYVESGSIIKTINDYVKAGDIIVSGLIYLEEDLKNIVEAKANVYGEVWYNVNVEFPLFYSEVLYSNNDKKQFNLEIFNLKEKHQYNFLEKEIFSLEHNLLPVKLSYGIYSKEIINEKVYTVEEALNTAMNLSREKILSTLNSEFNESILEEKVLSFYQKDDIINIEIFYKVYEIISESKSISMED